MRLRPRGDKLINTAAIAPVMPGIKKKKAAKTSDIGDVRNDVYGIPRLALRLIIVNCLFWLLAVVVFFAPHLPTLQLLMALLVVCVLIMLWLALNWLISKAFWWFVVLYSTGISIALLIIFVQKVIEAADKVGPF